MAGERDPSWEDGIRNLRREEFPKAAALLNTVFRPTIVAEYPHIYTPENTGNMLVAVEGGQVVSHMGTLRRYASLLGCTVRVACLGGVGTLADFRGKGYATALLEETIRFCREDRVDYMMVSGYRKMYHRQGCRRVGRDWRYVLPSERADGLDDGTVRFIPASAEDVPAMAEIYRREPIRWLRPPSDFQNALVGRVMNRPASTFLMCEEGRLQGYVIVQDLSGAETDSAQILEFAGDRKALVGSLGGLLRACDAKSLSVHVLGCDRPLQDLLKGRGLTGTPANASGTALVIDFVQFMERMRPHFMEIVGETAANGLVFSQLGDEMSVTYGGDRVVICGASAASELIFGTLDGAESATLEGGGKAGEVLAEMFPLPALWYGPNYV